LIFDFGWGSPRPSSWIKEVLLLREGRGKKTRGKGKGGEGPTSKARRQGRGGWKGEG